MFFLAIRHLTSRKRQTVITLAGVALGVAAFVVFSGIMLGFQDYIINQLVNNDAHVRISKREEVIEERSLDSAFYPSANHIFWISPPSGRRDNAQIENPLLWIERLRRDPRVLAYSPQHQSVVMFSKSATLRTGKVIGSNPAQQIRVSSIQKYVTAGDFLQLGVGGQRLIAGDGLLKKLGARVGDNITVTGASGVATPYKVIGAFHFGIMGLDDSVAFSSIQDAQILDGTPSQISDIAIRLEDVSQAHEFADQYATLSVDYVRSWDQINANILSVFSMQNFIRSFITLSIMVVAAFGIYNILSILVNQKRKDIGILRSVGYDQSDIVHLFLIQGIILGVVGGVIGLGFGALFAHGMSYFRLEGMVDHMIISYKPQIYLSGFFMAVAASTLSSIFPARSASKLRPIDIVRSGE